MPAAGRSVWRFVIGALLYLGFAFVSPLALVAAPLGLMLLFQRPERRESLIAGALLGLAAWSALGPADAFGRFEGAWVCLLTGGTAIALAVRRPGRSLVGSGLLAVGTAAVAGALLVVVTPFSFGELRWLAERHFGLQARVLLEAMNRGAAVSGAEGSTDLLQGVELAFNQMVALVSQLLPGLVLLQSMAALAAAWALYRWLARHPEGEPLPKLREFRFDDHLIWGVVLALIALVLPGASAVRDLGGNLAAFFGGLYVMRGLGIVAALSAAVGMTGLPAALMAVFAVIFLAPFLVLGALALGVLDTWVDFRKFAGRKPAGS